MTAGLLVLALAGCLTGETHPDYFTGEPTGIQPHENDFIHADGRLLKDGAGKPVLIRGVAFGNDVWANPSQPPRTHHSEQDYARVASMGFNSVRFYINYGIFEDDNAPYHYKESGFEWLDQNILWAKKHGIRLIVNMHFPQGGFQSNGAGDALWNNRSNQKRLAALWKEIARRYADEPVILGWDLLNEPVVTRNLNQWRDLAAEITWNIRQVDPKHLIIVERINANKGRGADSWHQNQNGEMNFFLLNDRNIMYEFHTYIPMMFTHQGASWIDSVRNAVAVWPDPRRLEGGGSLVWKDATFANPEIPAGDTPWTRFEGVPFTVTQASHHIGRPALQGNGLERGTVWFDDMEITEKDPKGRVVQTIMLDFNTDEGYYYWSSPVGGRGVWSSDEGRNGSGCWKITGSPKDAVLADGTNSFRITPGHTWTVSGWMRGEGVPLKGSARLRLDFYSSEGEIYIWNRDFLEAELDRYLAFGEKHQVPLYLGEFGCIRGAFEHDRGGERWVEDILYLCRKRDLNYNYHAWHEYAFGIYRNDTTELPADPNLPLIELFTRVQTR